MQPSAVLATVSERRSHFENLFKEADVTKKSYKIWAGKFRRYHNESFFRRVVDIKTILLNIRDFFLFFIGLIEAIITLIRFKPDVVFIKGGYVGVPVGFASRILRIPYITHDSDAQAGLTNRLIGKHAKLNLVGMPTKQYQYEKSKIRFTGIPIDNAYSSPKDIKTDKLFNNFDIKRSMKVLLVLGGSNGAQRLDRLVLASIESILTNNKNLMVLHQVGEGNEDLYKYLDNKFRARTVTTRFISPLAPAIKAADVIISRAGATTLTEIAALKKPAIIVPHPELSGGHQLENARILEDAKAALVLDERTALENALILNKAIELMINKPSEAVIMGNNLRNLLPSDGSYQVAELLIEASYGK